MCVTSNKPEWVGNWLYTKWWSSIKILLKFVCAVSSRISEVVFIHCRNHNYQTGKMPYVPDCLSDNNDDFDDTKNYNMTVGLQYTQQDCYVNFAFIIICIYTRQTIYYSESRFTNDKVHMFIILVVFMEQMKWN